MATAKKRSKKPAKRVVRRVPIGKCKNVGRDIKAKGNSDRARRRRAADGACLVQRRVKNPVKATTRIVLSKAESDRRKRARTAKRRAAARAKRPAAKRRSSKNGRLPYAGFRYEVFVIGDGFYSVYATKAEALAVAKRKRPAYVLDNKTGVETDVR